MKIFELNDCRTKPKSNLHIFIDIDNHSVFIHLPKDYYTQISFVHTALLLFIEHNIIFELYRLAIVINVIIMNTYFIQIYSCRINSYHF